MNTIQLAGQVISSTNYATDRIFNFNPDPIREAGENFLASGITELEIPEAVLDPNQTAGSEGVDRETLARTINMLPTSTRVIGSYLGGYGLGSDHDQYLSRTKKIIAHLVENFEDIQYVMIHPASTEHAMPDIAKSCVDTWCELADFAAATKEGFQLCLHNHFDSACETAEQVRAHLDLLRAANHPNLKWGPDTGHCHGMGEAYLEVFDEYADLIGNHFHIKARVPAFDQLHGREEYRADRDIWGNKAEFGKGLYSGFVNCADPEIQTPLTDVFRIIREKAQPTDGKLTGAIEIDVPRQHPRLEVMCSTLYLKAVHSVPSSQDLSYEQIMERVFSL